MAASADLTIKLIGQNMVSGMFKNVTADLKGLGAAVTAPARAVAGLAVVGVKGLGAIGLAGLGLSAVTGAAKGLGGALGIGLNAELENTRAQFLAITKDGAGTDKMLASFQKRADKTPFGFLEIAKAGAMLLPVAKSTKQGLDPLLDTASMLAALNPAEGLEGAAFSLREALSGDFVSIVERFNLPRDRINALKKQGVPAMKIINQVLQEMGIDMSLVTAMGETFEGRLSTLKDTINGFRRTLAAPLFEEMKAGLIVIQGFLDRNKEGINAWATAWGKRIGAAAGATVRGIETMLDFFTSLRHFLSTGQMFDDAPFQGLIRAIGVGRDAFAAFFGTLSDGEEDLAELTGLPRLFGEFGLALHKAAVFMAPFTMAFKDLATAIAHVVKGNAGIGLFIGEFKRLFGIDISGIVGRFQILFVQIGQIIRDAAEGDVGGAVSGLLDLIVGARLDLIEAVGTWAAAFVNWLTPHIPAILSAVGQVVVAIGNWVQTRGPELQARLMGWVTAFTGWVAPMIPPLLAHLQQVVAQLGAWIQAQTPVFLQQFLSTWAPAFVDWLADAGERALPHLTLFLMRLKAWVSANAAPLLEHFIAEWGPPFVNWLASAAMQIVPRLLEFQANIAKWAVTEGVPALIQIGLDLGAALIKGIFQALATLEAQIRERLNAATGGILGGGQNPLLPAVPGANPAVGQAAAIAAQNNALEAERNRVLTESLIVARAWNQVMRDAPTDMQVAFANALAGI